MQMSAKHGSIAENFFSSLLFKHGLNYTFVDDWFDYLVESHKVEIKGCQMTIKGNSKLKCKKNRETSAIRERQRR